MYVLQPFSIHVFTSPNFSSENIEPQLSIISGFNIVTVSLDGAITGKDSPEVFRHPEGAAHKAMRQALGKTRFGFIDSRRHIGEMILGEDFYGSQGEHYFWPKEYSSAKTAQKRIGKLEAAGMRCELTGCNGGYIRLLGYTPETESSLERERQEYATAYRTWQSRQNLKTT